MNLTYSEMTVDNIGEVLGFYIDYYNNVEESCWTEETAGKRIHQVLTIEDSYSLILRDDDKAVGFVMGYFKQYDDIVGYTLEEIVVSREYQGKGLGSELLAEVEKRVHEKGAFCVELQAVNDEMHEHYYGKAGYGDAANFVMKNKWFD
ncbi:MULTISPECIES: GNAT family N-acetyltransferase [Pseudobutyrivibrio]|uniref:Acetyltransferase (GNAT) family protein n=1 Tax=Pseudobutyrivibrio xylanivorans TaxID=185007 RepID=A0A1G5S3L4_PSEXY|nr:MULTISPECIES: GNAT family N-acetyltransferase [Pseudobutyrivibrio]MDC7280544.1 GNAT family N-acetyltransferase [Butyrivibrio fibrisolvens]SCZ80420.1 Acetyltransferase (GNAT) family protein [Pseudobutyrivibrio xylanivorans]